MKQIGVQFSEKQHLQIADLMEKVGAKQSQVVRAALQIGLAELRGDACNDAEKALYKVLIQEAKSLN